MSQTIENTIRAAVVDFLSHPTPGAALDLGLWFMRWIDDHTVELVTPTGVQVWEFYT